MNYFEEISFDNPNNQKLIEKQLYQNYLRNSIDIPKDKFIYVEIDINHLENIFTKKVYYEAMKSLSNIEKQILYLFVCEKKSLKQISKILKLSKKEVSILKDLAIKHFKDNVNNLKNGGALNE